MKISPKHIVVEHDNGIVIKNLPGYFLVFCLVLTAVFLWWLLEPFVIALILAAILATAFHPLYVRILSRMPSRSRLAAFITCLLILILLVVPLVIFVLLLTKQAVDTYGFVRDQIQTGSFDNYLRWESGNIFYDILAQVQGQFGSSIDFENVDLKKNIIDLAQSLSTFLIRQSTFFLKGLGEMLLNLFILFFALYYFLKDAPVIGKKLMALSPFPHKYNLELFKKFKEMSEASLYGVFLTAMAQGALGGIGFMLAGIPSALFWGTAIAFASLIPLVGTALIWFPAAIILLLTGNIVGGVVLLLWGFLVVGTVDNFLRAFLIGNRVKMNPLLAFMAVFGGITLFGLIGVIFGPLIIMLFFTFLHIYELEYRVFLKKL